MAKTDFKSVDEYLDTLQRDDRDALQKIRETIMQAVPGAEETISYQIPAVKFHGWIFYFSVYKNHFSLACPPTSNLFEDFAKELEPYKVSKSTIQFPKDKPVPYGLIAEMSKYRAKDNLEKMALKGTK